MIYHLIVGLHEGHTVHKYSFSMRHPLLIFKFLALICVQGKLLRHGKSDTNTDPSKVNIERVKVKHIVQFQPDYNIHEYPMTKNGTPLTGIWYHIRKPLIRLFIVNCIFISGFPSQLTKRA